MDTIKYLQEAKELVSAGWCQNTATWLKEADGTRCYCALEAASQVTLEDESNTFSEVVRALNDALDEIGAPKATEWFGFPGLADRVVKWNDVPERTQDDVVYLYELAIELKS